MTEDPNPIDEPSEPDDSPPSSDPVKEPDVPKPLQSRRKRRPETPAKNLEVTPLDEGEHIKDGIEVDEK
jgi:hypothetical protein